MKKRVIYGIYFVAAAMIILLFASGVMGDVPVFKAVVPIILLPVFISGARKLGFARMILPVAITVIVFSEELGITHISPWLIILAAILLSVGLNMLVPRKTRLLRKLGIKSSELKGTGTADTGSADPDNIRINSHFGGVEKYVESRNFTSATVECAFSGISIFFDKANLNTDGAKIFFDAKYSGIQLYVPRDWQVINKLDASMSGVDIRESSDSPLKLTLYGKVSLCGLDVKYI